MNRDHAAIQRVLILTFVLNLTATAAKLGVGLMTGALSLIADGLDTLFDGLSNVIGVIAVRMGSQPPDEDHPYGHRKYETLAALIIAILLFVTAWELGKGAVDRLIDPPTDTVVNGWSVAALIFGGVVQGVTGWWEMRQGRKLGSEVIVADARHTLASIYVSLAVLIGLGLVWLGYPWADPVVALIVAGVIARIGVETVRENIPALVDHASLDPESIGQVVAEVAGVESFHRIRSRGPVDSVAVDLHVRVAPRLSMQEGNAIGDEVRRRLLDLPNIEDVTVHIEAERGPESAADLYAAVKLAADEHDLTVHEFWVQQIDGDLLLHLHIGVDPNLRLADAHARVDAFETTVRERYPQVTAIHTHIELATAEILPASRVSRGMQERVAAVVIQAADDVPGLSAPHNIHVHQMEGQLFITLDAFVDGAISVVAAHELSTRLQEQVRGQIGNVSEVLVHLEPAG